MPKQDKIDQRIAEVDRRPENLTHGRVLYIIHELSRLIAANFDKAMARHNLTHAQWWAVMHIYENQGATQSDLADLMQMGRASAGKLLERMEAKGWIERRPDPSDTRVRRVYLADAATPVFMLMADEGLALFEDLLGSLGAEAEGKLLDGLRQVRENAKAGLLR